MKGLHDIVWTDVESSHRMSCSLTSRTLDFHRLFMSDFSVQVIDHLPQLCFLNIASILCVYSECNADMCVCAPVYCSAHGGHKNVLDLQELESWTVVNCHVAVGN